MKTLDPANLQGIRDDMDLYDRIRDKISGLASTLKDMNTLTPEMHQDANFSHLFDAIEKRMKEVPATSSDELAREARTPESSPAPKPLGNVNANNGKLAIGNIHSRWKSLRKYCDRQ